MADLKTNYKDDVLNTSVNEKRKFNMIQNSDGTVSFEDVTEYTQTGDSFGAADINATNAAVNEANSNLSAVDTPILIANDTSKSYTILASEIDNYKKIQVIALNTAHNSCCEITMYIDTIKALGTGKTYVNMSFSPSSSGATYTQTAITYDNNGNLVCGAGCGGTWAAERVVVLGFK